MFSMMLAALATAGVASVPSPGVHTRRLDVDGRERRYQLYIPRGLDPANPAPAVVVFHGGGGNPESMARLTAMNTKADAAGFVVLYPAGTGHFNMLTFNAGNCCGLAMEQRIDDVAFTRALLDDLGRAIPVDRRRIYATGLSNGAMMAYRVAAELSDRIAAIAPVGGPAGMTDARPARPVPVMHFHGTADSFAPFPGGKGTSGFAGRGPRTDFQSVDQSIRMWLRINGASADPVEIELPTLHNDGTRVIRREYRDGKAPVVLLLIEGGGHTWPGQEPPLKSLGKSTRNLDANDAMWEFFSMNPMP